MTNDWNVESIIAGGRRGGMTKQEIEELVGAKLDAVVFDNVGGAIVNVYKNYPAMSENEEKRKAQMRGLYRNFGWVIFLDMDARARRCEEEKRKVEELEARLEAMRRVLKC